MSNEKRRSWWSSTRRDLDGAARAARERARSAGGQLDDLADAIEGERPERTSDPEIDFDEIITDVTPEMVERIKGDPLLTLLFAKLDHERKRRANQVAEAIGVRTPAEVAKDVKAMKWKVNLIWYLLCTVAVAAGGSVFAVGGWLVQRGAKEEAHAISHKLLEMNGNDREHRLRAVEVLLQQTAQRVSDHLTGHSVRRSDAAWQPQPSPVTPSTP